MAAMPIPTTPVPTRSSAEAQVVAALLRAHGIPVYIAGQLLQDEFGVVQRALGTAGTVLEVPTADLLRAQALLAAARAEGRGEEPLTDDELPPPGP